MGFKNKENELLSRFQIGNIAPRRQARQLPMLVARNQGSAVCPQIVELWTGPDARFSDILSVSCIPKATPFSARK